MTKHFILVISCVLAVLSLNAQDIATTRNASLGSTVTFRGVSLNGPELPNIRYIQDATGGIAIYGSNVSSINEGDSVLITGTMTNYNNLVEVTPVTSMSVLANVALPAAQVITDVSLIDDQYEGELLHFDNCTFANGGALFAGNTNYNVTIGGQTLQIRILNGSPLIGEVIPSGAVNLTGIMSQYCFSPTTGCTSGYQLLLRTINDIEATSSIFLTQPISTAGITTTGFDIHWSTNIPGDNSYIKYGVTPALEMGTITSGNTTNHVATLTGLTPATIYYVRAYSWNGVDSAVTLERTFVTQSLSSGTIKTYFNRVTDISYSTGTNAVFLNHRIADTLAAYIDRTNSSLDIAIYNWDHSPDAMKIITAVNNAYNRGVKIRVISDGSTVNSGVNGLNNAIPVLSTPQGSDYTIMHNKFVIMDANVSNPDYPVVWTGSTNFTEGQLDDDANNVIVFQDQSLARGYKMEFDEMWGDSSQNSQPNMTMSRFGQFKTDNTPHEYVIGGKRVESYFSPSDQVNTQILNTIETADDDLYFAVMVITRSDLAYAIRDRIQTQSLAAKGIIDDASTSATPYGILNPSMGTSLAVNGHNWIFHHKYLVVDASNPASDPIVLTGSHNWSNGADQKNDENTVIVHDASIANQYYQDFMGRWCERNGGTCSLGLEESSNDMQLLIYPNPTTGAFAIQVPGDGNTADITITDITGKQVYHTQKKTVSGNNTVEITDPFAKKGIYLVTYESNGTVLTSRIVIE
ncbi:phospholipase D-like domain-containing protein [Fluviicola chungangensis]|uniref:phospholipase D n=1 Tax=Fluviicola chungangensis TaxID=2597671 RepID=A0A556MQ30_9FLAO|nr:phospholipase D-like domain-containing protein [Fluviicola chungangensis]TSJ42057.1 T9SS type A sorting domain-containing protein [Fluviicola chungangensis]